MDRTVLFDGLLALAAFFWVVLPASILVVSLVVMKRAPIPPVGARLCAGAKVTDPSAKMCWVPQGVTHCDRHRPIEMA